MHIQKLENSLHFAFKQDGLQHVDSLRQAQYMLHVLSDLSSDLEQQHALQHRARARKIKAYTSLTNPKIGATR